jgi:hypothetical protein
MVSYLCETYANALRRLKGDARRWNGPYGFGCIPYLTGYFAKTRQSYLVVFDLSLLPVLLVLVVPQAPDSRRRREAYPLLLGVLCG